MMYKVTGKVCGATAVKYGFSVNMPARLAELSLVIEDLKLERTYECMGVDWKKMERALHKYFEDFRLNQNLRFGGHTEVYPIEEQRTIDKFIREKEDSFKCNVLNTQYTSQATAKLSLKLLYSSTWVNDKGEEFPISSDTKLIYIHRLGLYNWYRYKGKQYKETYKEIHIKLGIPYSKIKDSENLLYHMGLLTILGSKKGDIYSILELNKMEGSMK